MRIGAHTANATTASAGAAGTSRSAPPPSSSQRVYLGLGGNQGDSRQILSTALAQLEQLPYSRLVAHSRPWHTPPWGETDQASFLNLAVALDTALAPIPLLDALLDLERRLGRQRHGRRWGPRLIDTDLLLYGQRVIRHPRLQVPHPYLHQRAFVLCPLLELDEQLEIPGLGSARQQLAALDIRGHYPADFQLSL